MGDRLVQIQNRSKHTKITLSCWDDDVQWMVREIQWLRTDLCSLLAAINCSDGIYTSGSECRRLVKDAITKIEQHKVDLSEK